jgi:hypothetical protein
MLVGAFVRMRSLSSSRSDERAYDPRVEHRAGRAAEEEEVETSVVWPLRGRPWSLVGHGEVRKLFS